MAPRVAINSIFLIYAFFSVLRLQFDHSTPSHALSDDNSAACGIIGSIVIDYRTLENIVIKELIKDPDILSRPCEPATADDVEVAQDLLDTLASLEEAACLAANQIGVAKRVVVYRDDNDQPHVLYNPVLKQALGAFKATEGCLSLEADSKVTRYDRIKVAYDELVDGALQPRKKDFTGWTAQTVQHMIDHCKGKLV